MNICVVGSGYVGLVTGVCLADFGMHVVGVDKDHAKVEALSRGKVPIYEPGLETLVQKNMEEGRLRFSTELGPAIEEAQAVFIAVGTPPKPDGSADLTFIREVAASIAEHLNGYKIIVTKSTVPIGTGQMIEAIVREGAGSRHKFAVVSNPEFLREGSAIEDFMQPDRVVIGTRDPRAAELMLDVYSPLVAADVPFIVTDVETAELIKYASNGFLATKISFINEVAQHLRGLGRQRRGGRPRVWGSTAASARSSSPPAPATAAPASPRTPGPWPRSPATRGSSSASSRRSSRSTRSTQKRMIVKIEEALGEIAGKTVGRPRPLLQAEHGRHPRVAGPAHRPGPARPRRHGAGLRSGGHGRGASRSSPTVDYCEDAYEAAEGADALVIVTEWNQFRKLELDRLLELLRQPLVIDLRNLYDPEKMAAAGFRYVSIGRPEGIPAGRRAAGGDGGGSAS